MACMVCCVVAQTIGFLDWERLVDHGLGDLWLLGNHDWLVNVGVVAILVAIDGRSVTSHGFKDCALFDIFVQMYRCVT